MFEIGESTRVFVCPTDTIYGLSARANDIEAIERIKELKGREDTRFIVLLSDAEQLKEFGIEVTPRQQELLARLWPGSVTVAFDEETSFRVPDYPELQEFIKKVGPIVSTSANKHGKPPIKTIEEAKELFGDQADEYIDIGPLEGEPSTIINILR